MKIGQIFINRVVPAQTLIGLANFIGISIHLDRLKKFLISETAVDFWAVIFSFKLLENTCITISDSGHKGQISGIANDHRSTDTS